MESQITSKVFEYGVHYREEEIKSKATMIAQSPPFLVADTPSGLYYFECALTIDDYPARTHERLWHLIDPLVRNVNPAVELNHALEVIRENQIKHILEPGELGATFELIVSDTKTGKITEHRPPQKSKSFVRGFLELLWVQAYQISPMTAYLIRDTSNIQHYIQSGTATLAVNAPINIDTWGIQAGIGVGAPTINDFALGNKITHGVGAGQLQYSASTFGAPASDATTSQFTITRNLANGSGGLITPTEIGLVAKSFRWSAALYYILTIRDVIGGGIAVPNGQTLTINYRPQTVV